jgi:hypothetical protein
MFRHGVKTRPWLAASLAVAASALVSTASAPAADLILNEYNAVSGSRFLEGTSSDAFWGRRTGNGGDWFELAVVSDHLDVRGWQLEAVDRAGDPLNAESFVFTFSDEPIWSSLRSGTILTVSEDLGNNTDDYHPQLGQWWINVKAAPDTSGTYISVECLAPACAPSAVNWKTSNNDWQLTIKDDVGNVVFGPAGEGINPLTGVGSTEVFKLEEDPSASITPLSGYMDGSSSTFGQPNEFNGGADVQDFSSLRSLVPYSPLTDVRVNEVFSHSDPGVDWVELYNDSAATVDVGGWFLSDSFDDLTRFRIPDGTTIPAGAYFVFEETDLGFALSAACGDEIVLSQGDGVVPTGPRDFAEFGAVENGVAFGRADDGAGPFVRLAAPTRGAKNTGLLASPVVVNEIMYHPPIPAPGVTVNPEFIELFNASGQAVDLATSYGLQGTYPWRLKGGVDFDFPLVTTMPAGAFLVVVSFDPDAEPTMLAEFRQIYGLDESVEIVGPYDGGLNNFSDVVRLAKPDTPDPDGDLCGGTGNPSPYVPYVVVDDVEYVDFGAWPDAADGGGASLERIDPLALGNDPANWAANLDGAATPGAPNSVGGVTTTTMVQPPTTTMTTTSTSQPPTTSVPTTTSTIATTTTSTTTLPAECAVAADCDDGNACTVDDCTGGLCSNEPPCDLTCNACEPPTCRSLCGVPVSRGQLPTVNDALFALRASVGLAACQPCLCDVDSTGAVVVSDALRLLKRAVGIVLPIACPAAGS